MKIVTIDWLPEQARFEARGGHPGQVHRPSTLRTTAPRPASAPPSSCWPVSAAARPGTWSRSCASSGSGCRAIEVRVEGEQATDPPWPFERVRLHFTVTGHRLNAGKVRKAVELSERRYCTVIATIRGVAEVTCLVDVLEADAEGGIEPARERIHDADPADSAISDATA